jgi:hypothetical protein
MAKTEKTTPRFDEEDVLIMMNTVARIAIKLQKIATYDNPKELAAKILQDLKHKKILNQAFVIYNFNNMDVATFYSPLDLKNEIAKSMQVNTLYDNTDILTTLQESKTVNSNDITKALKTLEKETGLIILTGKEEIRKARITQKIKFLGRPSLWRFPPNSEGMKKIMSKPKAIELIFRSLINMGLLPHLEFLWQASFYIVKEQAKNQNVYELIKSAEKSMDHGLNARIDQQSLEYYRSFLLSVPEEQLRLLAHKLCEFWVCYPRLCRSILLLGLYISP